MIRHRQQPSTPFLFPFGEPATRHDNTTAAWKGQLCAVHFTPRRHLSASPPVYSQRPVYLFHFISNWTLPFFSGSCSGSQSPECNCCHCYLLLHRTAPHRLACRSGIWIGSYLEGHHPALLTVPPQQPPAIWSRPARLGADYILYSYCPRPSFLARSGPSSASRVPSWPYSYTSIKPARRRSILRRDTHTHTPTPTPADTLGPVFVCVCVSVSTPTRAILRDRAPSSATPRRDIGKRPSPPLGLIATGACVWRA